MAAYTANASQTVDPGETVVFTATVVPCMMGLVLHSDDTGNFLISGRSCGIQNGCACRRTNVVNYDTTFGANIAIPTGGTPGEISVAITVDGATIPASTMIATPAAVEEFSNVSRRIPVPIFKGCCQSVAVRNTSDQPILVQNASLVINR
jgi:hypothetical protein